MEKRAKEGFVNSEKCIAYCIENDDDMMGKFKLDHFKVFNELNLLIKAGRTLHVYSTY